VGAVVSSQVAPESLEVYIPPPRTTAANLVPSSEEATHIQYCGDGALVSRQVLPESLEVYIPPNQSNATNLVPFVEAATPNHAETAVDTALHDAPELPET
jgi:hypothetical protein